MLPQLRMTFPLEKLGSLVIPPVADGFELQLFSPDKLDEYIDLMQSAGFDCWNREYAGNVLKNALPEGIFFAVDRASGRLAATAMANRANDIGSEMGWVAARPEFRGHGLSRVVCAAALKRLELEKPSHIYLLTDDFRLAALKVYLTMGWEQECCDESHEERWRSIHAQLNL